MRGRAAVRPRRRVSAHKTQTTPTPPGARGDRALVDMVPPPHLDPPPPRHRPSPRPGPRHRRLVSGGAEVDRAGDGVRPGRGAGGTPLGSARRSFLPPPRSGGRGTARRSRRRPAEERGVEGASRRQGAATAGIGIVSPECPSDEVRQAPLGDIGIRPESRPWTSPPPAPLSVGRLSAARGGAHPSAYAANSSGVPIGNASFKWSRNAVTRVLSSRREG